MPAEVALAWFGRDLIALWFGGPSGGVAPIIVTLPVVSVAYVVGAGSSVVLSALDRNRVPAFLASPVAVFKLGRSVWVTDALGPIGPAVGSIILAAMSEATFYPLLVFRYLGGGVSRRTTTTRARNSRDPYVLAAHAPPGVQVVATRVLRAAVRTVFLPVAMMSLASLVGAAGLSFAVSGLGVVWSLAAGTGVVLVGWASLIPWVGCAQPELVVKVATRGAESGAWSGASLRRCRRGHRDEVHG